MLASRMEKPPVEIVVSAVVIASNSGSPQCAAAAPPHGERDVDAVQDARRLTRAGAELCADGAGGFCFHQVHAALTELGQQRQHENEDTHAAHPLRERAPELDAPRQRRRRREDGRAGRRQAGDGLENGVDKAAAAAEKYGSAPNTLSAIQHSATQTKPSRVWSRACPRG